MYQFDSQVSWSPCEYGNSHDTVPNECFEEDYEQDLLTRNEHSLTLSEEFLQDIMDCDEDSLLSLVENRQERLMLINERRIFLAKRQSIMEAEEKEENDIARAMKISIQGCQHEKKKILASPETEKQRVRRKMKVQKMKKVVQFNWLQMSSDPFCHILTFLEFQELRGGLARVNKSFKEMCYSPASYRHVRIDMRFMQYVLFAPKVSVKALSCATIKALPTPEKAKPQQTTTESSTPMTMCDICGEWVSNWKWSYIGAKESPHFQCWCIKCLKAELVRKIKEECIDQCVKALGESKEEEVKIETEEEDEKKMDETARERKQLATLCKEVRALPLGVQQRFSDIMIASDKVTNISSLQRKKKMQKMLNELILDPHYTRAVWSNQRLRQFRNLESLVVSSDCVTGFLDDSAGELVLHEILTMLVNRNKSKIRSVRLAGQFTSRAFEEFRTCTAISMEARVAACVDNLVTNMAVSRANNQDWDNPSDTFPDLNFTMLEKSLSALSQIMTFGFTNSMKLYEHVCQLLANSNADVENLSLQCSFSVPERSTFPLLSTYFPNVKALSFSSCLPLVSKWLSDKSSTLAFDSAKWKSVESITVDAKNFYSLVTAIHKDFIRVTDIHIVDCQESGFLASTRPVLLPSVRNVSIMYRLANKVVSIAEEQRIFDGIKNDLRKLLTMMPNVNEMKIGADDTLRYSNAYLRCFQPVSAKTSICTQIDANVSGIAWNEVFDSRLYDKIRSLSIDIDAFGFIKYLKSEEQKNTSKSKNSSLRSLHLSFPDNIDVCRTLIEARIDVIHNQLFKIEDFTLLFCCIDETQVKSVMTNVSHFLKHMFWQHKTVERFILKFGNIRKISDDGDDYEYEYECDHDHCCNGINRLALCNRADESVDDMIFGILIDFNRSGLEFLHLCLPLTDDYIKYLQVVGTVSDFGCSISRDYENKQLNILLEKN